eukprot:m.182862 g.182862  ORF g.182862 m.182862 type:complete len:948 (+) comp16890_c0_seq2:695-3538(+)
MMVLLALLFSLLSAAMAGEYCSGAKVDTLVALMEINDCINMSVLSLSLSNDIVPYSPSSQGRQFDINVGEVDHLIINVDSDYWSPLEFVSFAKLTRVGLLTIRSTVVPTGDNIGKPFGYLQFPLLHTARDVELGSDDYSTGHLPAVSGSLVPLTILNTLKIGNQLTTSTLAGTYLPKLKAVGLTSTDPFGVVQVLSGTTLKDVTIGSDSLEVAPTLVYGNINIKCDLSVLAAGSLHFSNIQTVTGSITSGLCQAMTVTITPFKRNSTNGYTIGGEINSGSLTTSLYLPAARALSIGSSSNVRINGWDAMGTIENCSTFGVAILEQSVSRCACMLNEPKLSLDKYCRPLGGYSELALTTSSLPTLNNARFHRLSNGLSSWQDASMQVTLEFWSLNVSSGWDSAAPVGMWYMQIEDSRWFLSYPTAIHDWPYQTVWVELKAPRSRTTLNLVDFMSSIQFEWDVIADLHFVPVSHNTYSTTMATTFANHVSSNRNSTSGNPVIIVAIVVGVLLTVVVLIALILLVRSRKQGGVIYNRPSRLDHELRQLLDDDDTAMLEGDKYVENRDTDDREKGVSQAQQMHGRRASAAGDDVDMISLEDAELLMSLETPTNWTGSNSSLNQTSMPHSGADIDAGRLISAVTSDNLADLTFALTRGQDANATDSNYRTALHHTSLHMTARTQAARLLLQHGANPNIADCDGMTPTHLAASNDHLELLELLHSYGADINAKNRLGLTPLMLAASRGYDHVVQLLLSAQSIDRFAQDNRGSTALHWAAATNAVQACAHLIATDDDESTYAQMHDDIDNMAVHVAAKEGNLEALEVLLSYGHRNKQLMQLVAVNSFGLQPLDLAREAGADDCLHFIAKAIADRSSRLKVPVSLPTEVEDVKPSADDQSKWPSRKEYMRYKRAQERERKQALEGEVTMLRHEEDMLQQAVLDVKTDIVRLQQLT